MHRETPSRQHRVASAASIHSRVQRMNAKAFNLAMPEALHAVVKQQAQELAAQVGGQVNINKVIVTRLYESVRASLTDSERSDCELFIAQL